jgi:hypothetical protein
VENTLILFNGQDRYAKKDMLEHWKVMIKKQDLESFIRGSWPLMTLLD